MEGEGVVVEDHAAEVDSLEAVEVRGGVGAWPTQSSGMRLNMAVRGLALSLSDSTRGKWRRSSEGEAA